MRLPWLTMDWQPVTRFSNLSALRLLDSTSREKTSSSFLKPGLVPEDVARLVVTVLNDLLPDASGANIPLFSNR